MAIKMKLFNAIIVATVTAGSLMINIGISNANGIKEICTSSGGQGPTSSHDCWPEYGEKGVDLIMINLFADRMFTWRHGDAKGWTRINYKCLYNKNSGAKVCVN